jgi:serine/threonine protein kinase
MQTFMGRYTVDAEIGRGGMGVVYRARDGRLGKTVAVKVLSQTSSLSPDSRARFRQEARAAAILNHPSIVNVFDFAEQDGVPFIVYEYVEGTRLDTLIAGRNLTETRVIEIGGQLAGALAYAHERGILHRDIKPQNVIVTPEGRAKILDFGLAKRARLEFVPEVSETIDTKSENLSFETARGTVVGTVQYMSPEQIGGEQLDGRSDIFSLGIVLYEMITGSNPFRGDSFASTIGKIVSPEAPAIPATSMRVSPELQEIVRRSLQKRREDRYPSAKMLADELERLRSSGSGWLKPQPIGEQPDVVLIPKTMSRVCAILLQVMYLATYGVALFYLGDFVNDVLNLVRDYVTGNYSAARDIARWVTTVLMITGCCGIALRLYLIASVGFDDPETGIQFRKLFPFLFILDEIWALTPLLLYSKWRPGVTILCLAFLAYAPIAQRNLIRNAYPSRRSGTFDRSTGSSV